MTPPSNSISAMVADKNRTKLMSLFSKSTWLFPCGCYQIPWICLLCVYFLALRACGTNLFGACNVLLGVCLWLLYGRDFKSIIYDFCIVNTLTVLFNSSQKLMSLCYWNRSLWFVSVWQVRLVACCRLQRRVTSVLCISSTPACVPRRASLTPRK